MKLLPDWQALMASSLPWRCFTLGYMLGFLTVMVYILFDRDEAGDHASAYMMSIGIILLFMVGRWVINSDGIKPHLLKDQDESVSRLPKSE